MRLNTGYHKNSSTGFFSVELFDAHSIVNAGIGSSIRYIIALMHSVKGVVPKALSNWPGRPLHRNGKSRRCGQLLAEPDAAGAKTVEVAIVNVIGAVEENACQQCGADKENNEPDPPFGIVGGLPGFRADDGHPGLLFLPGRLRSGGLGSRGGSPGIAFLGGGLGSRLLIYPVEAAVWAEFGTIGDFCAAFCTEHP